MWIVLIRMCIMLLCIGAVLYGDAPYLCGCAEVLLLGRSEYSALPCSL